MATFQELMQAAVNADKAGDTAAAAQLVQMARSMQGATEQPKVADVAGTGSLQPKAYDPNSVVATPQYDNFGDTIAAATEGPISATKAFARGVVDQAQSPTMQALPDWLPENVKSGVARVGDVAMTGLAGAGTAYAFGAGLAGELFGGSPTNEQKLARDLMMMGEVSVPELAGVSSVTMANRVAAGNAARANKPLTAVQRTARAADDLGITPSLGAGGKVRGQIAASFEKVPFSGGVIERDAVRFVDDIERVFQQVTASAGQARGAADAGAALQRGLGTYVTKFKANSERLFANVARYIPSDTKVYAPETRKMIADALAPFADSPAIRKRLGLDQWAKIADDLENGISWEAAAQLRSSLGKSIGKINGPLADMDQGRLKLAYGRLTADMEAAAKQAGPKAERAWRRAQDYYRTGAQRISDTLDQTINAKSPERAFEAFVNMSKEGRSSADAARMRSIKKAMPAAEWKEVSASIVDRLGRAPAGQQNAAGDVFSPSAFLTNWNKMTPEAKSVLMTPDVRKQLDLLAEVAEGAKRANAERNFSNTGTAVGQFAAGAGAIADPVVTGSALLGANISARAMTSQRFLSALNKAARGDARMMQTLARGRGPIAQDAITVLRITAAEAAARTAPANNDASPVNLAN